jgi:hypothetical protein
LIQLLSSNDTQVAALAASVLGILASKCKAMFPAPTSRLDRMSDDKAPWQHIPKSTDTCTDQNTHHSQDECAPGVWPQRALAEQLLSRNDQLSHPCISASSLIIHHGAIPSLLQLLYHPVADLVWEASATLVLLAPSCSASTHTTIQHIITRLRHTQSHGSILRSPSCPQLNSQTNSDALGTAPAIDNVELKKSFSVASLAHVRCSADAATPATHAQCTSGADTSSGKACNQVPLPSGNLTGTVIEFCFRELSSRSTEPEVPCSGYFRLSTEGQ